jgi:poly [ADP-ribose] polymerase
MATATAVKVLETRMFVAVDPSQNNNRFYKVEILSEPVTETGRGGKVETGHIRTTWGRVGAPNVESQLLNDDAVLAKKIREKTNRKELPYTEVKTVGTASEQTTKTTAYSSSNGKATSSEVKKAAVEEIAGGCPITAALVKKLAETNKHELVAATGGIQKGGMDIDLETGLVRTALGVVTLDAIKEARQVLDQMLPYVNRHDTDNFNYYGTGGLLSTYLRLVPQDVGTRRKGWHTDFINIAAQTSLLDQLETSVELAEQRITDASKVPGQPAVVKQHIFECKLRLLAEAAAEDRVIWERIKKSFFATVNYGHTSSGLKPIRLYEVTIPHMVQAFDADGKRVGNVRELWHGTRVFNILSILKRGFVLPNQLSTAQTTGAMFDNGVYFSDQSTKSLNYSQGYWGGGPRENNCYMFRVDVAMGRPYIPSGPDGRAASHCKRNGFDSCHAVANRSGVRNDEQIVYRTSQTNIRYLIEFNDR